MPLITQIKKGMYFDSVTLMNLNRKIGEIEGITDVAVVMGTDGNKAILQEAGFMTPEFNDSEASDLLIAVTIEHQKIGKDILAKIDAKLSQLRTAATSSQETYQPGSIEGALRIISGANLALISVPGSYASAEAWKAMNRGLHVMIFSDNVPIEEEIELKNLGSKRDLLVMGPDCGTAIINGIPLGFANAVRRGNIGIVAAAGTGLQEVSCIISDRDGGISQAVGTGGRDVKREVGGRTFLAALNALAFDEVTEVMLLVSKPPDDLVLKKIHDTLSDIPKPVVSVFLGAESGRAAKSSGRASHPPRYSAATLEEGALLALALANKDQPGDVLRQLNGREKVLRETASGEVKKRGKRQKYLRGLFSGGSLCAEGQVILSSMIADVFSNAPTHSANQIEDALRSQKNTLIDLGEDEFTRGRPHPMIDYSLRNHRIQEEADDPETAVILLDVVLGYGAHPDPAAALAPVLRAASQKVTVICSVTGTDGDPQNKRHVETALKQSGAIVMPSNAAASQLAGHILQILARK